MYAHDHYYNQPPASGVSFLLPYVQTLDTPAFTKTLVARVAARLNDRSSTDDDVQFLLDIVEVFPARGSIPPLVPVL